MSASFAFEFDPKARSVLWAFGASGRTSGVVVDDRLRARFGWVSLETPLSNVAGWELSGDYRWWTAIGVRTSLSDSGLTFGSNTRRGLCIRFHEPVAARPRFGWVKHPGLTVTVADPEGLAAALSAALDRSPGL